MRVFLQTEIAGEILAHLLQPVLNCVQASFHRRRAPYAGCGDCGSGIAGLSAGYTLDKQKNDFLLLELELQTAVIMQRTMPVSAYPGGALRAAAHAGIYRCAQTV